MSDHAFFAGDFGATGDGNCLNTRALQDAIEACAKAGGGKVVIAPGVYRTGGLVLRDHVQLHLEEGAVLLASENLADYPLRGDDPTPPALIFAEKAKHIAITGRGCIDGNGEAFWVKLAQPHDWAEAKKQFHIWVPHFDFQPKKRPRAMILFLECHDVRIEDVLIRNSMHWTILLMSCDKALIRGMVMNNPVHGPNTDGIDLDSCRDVLVENCDILTGDDAVCLKSKNIWGLKRTSRDITVRNCVLKSPTHGFTIGTETQADFENITFTDSLVVRAGPHRDNSAIDLSILDGAAIRNVRVSNIRIVDAVVPIHIRLGNAGRGQVVKQPGAIEDILIEKVTAQGALGVNLIAGLPGHPVRRVTLRDIAIISEGGIDPEKILREVPEIPEEYPPGPTWVHLPAHGFYCRHVENLDLSGIDLRTIHPDPRPSFVFDDVTGLQTRNIRAPNLRTDALSPAACLASA